MLVGALLALAGCDSGTPSAPSGPRVGDPVPAFEYPGVDRESVAIADYRGKALVINFWGTWCPPCREEMPSLQRLDDLIAARGGAVLGVSADSDVNLVREFLLQFGVRFPNGIDPKGEKSRELFGVTGYPTTLLVRADGIVAEVVIGPRNWDEPSEFARLAELLRLRADVR